MENSRQKTGDALYPPAIFYLLILSISVLFLLAVPPENAHAEDQEKIAIIVAADLMKVPVVSLAVQDTIELLRKGFPGASIILNNPGARVRIVLPDSEQIGQSNRRCKTPRRNYATLPAPQQDYQWSSAPGRNGIDLKLHASSPHGIASGLYGLLQEHLGFRFIHPRQTLFPHHTRWPLPAHFSMQANPRFEKRGFHLHTLHPTELAEQLNNPRVANSFSDVQEYLNWLARNGQNVVQFYLLRDAVTNEWTNHAKRIVNYAHDRGIMAGVAISLSMIQQRAYQLIKLLKPVPSYRRCIDKSLSKLFRVPWDFVTLELTMGEYLPDLGSLLPDTRDYLVGQITARYRTKLFFTTHVIRRTDQAIHPPTSGQRLTAPGTGILIHTVMNYSLSDLDAPVYGNKNLTFMRDRTITENQHRETWYWPESSYWIAYDNPVPLFLLTYLDARRCDIATMEKIGVAGHLTFSSGWEWGYWLVDWSIARWSWNYAVNGTAAAQDPLSTLAELLPSLTMTALWREALELEKLYLKKKELIRYMAAATPFSEFPPPLRKSFQPAPEAGYGKFSRGTSGDDRITLQDDLENLEEYSVCLERIVNRMSAEMTRIYAGNGGTQSDCFAIASELKTCLAVSALRARHRALTLRALIEPDKPGGPRARKVQLLQQAAAVRMKGLELVRSQEYRYRYPVAMIARQRDSMTAYRFGYLYPVSTLFFWKREEEQVRHGRFDPFYMNLWDFPRILGLGSLFF